jgi:hypothetical protein
MFAMVVKVSPASDIRTTKAMNKRTLALWLVFLGVLLATPAFSWDPTELPPGFTVADPAAPVDLDGKPLFHVRINAKAETAQQIAHRISERIKKLAQDPTFNPNPLPQDSP